MWGLEISVYDEVCGNDVLMKVCGDEGVHFAEAQGAVTQSSGS